jgi:hypothetical protein
MKIVLTRLLAISSLTLLMFASCTKNDPKIVSDGGTPGVLTASATTIVLDKANASDTATKLVTFKVTQPQINVSTPITNIIQIDSVGDNWKNPASIAFATGSLSESVNTADLNTALLKIVPGGVTSTVNVRVEHQLSPEVGFYSNVISLTVTPYSLASYIYIVGDFQGWSATSPDSLVSATSNGVYTGTFAFNTGNNQFLILPAKSFDNKYATTQANTVVPSTTVTYNGPNNFYAPAPSGNYTITLNLTALTINIVAAK